MNLWSALVAVVAIWGVVEIVRHWSKGKQAQPTDGSPMNADELDELRRRIETLERIITDDKESLRRKFDDL